MVEEKIIFLFFLNFNFKKIFFFLFKLSFIILNYVIYLNFFSSGVAFLLEF
jgi:hypothetical protein